MALLFTLSSRVITQKKGESASSSEARGRSVSKSNQAVEKVVVRPVSSPKQAQTPPRQVQYTFETGFSASERGSEKVHEGVFQQARGFLIHMKKKLTSIESRLPLKRKA